MRAFRRTTLGLLVAAGALSIATADAVEISMACAGVGSEQQICKEMAEAWSKRSGHTVKIVVMPTNATERLAVYSQILAARSSELDIIPIDVTWQAMLADHMIDMKPHAKGVEANYNQVIIENNTVNGKLVSMPAFTDVGQLFYRKDLLEKYGRTVPKTWAELTATAQFIQDAERKAGNDKMWGFVWQGRAYEGLTCDALEWIYSYGGGTIIDAKGEVTINNPKAIAALKLAQSWVNTITPPGVLNYAEEDSRGVWQTGNAVFMRNWSYAWALSQTADSPIKDKVGVAALPMGEGGTHTGTIGGWNMAVPVYSKHPEIAADYALFLTSRESQRIRATKYSQNPNWMALYDEADVVASNPILGNLKGLLATAVARPSRSVGTNYARVSAEFFNGVHAILSGAPVEAKVAEMEVAIRRAQRGR